MKRSVLSISLIVFCGLVGGVAYRTSPLAKSTRSLHVSIREHERGYQAIVENRGILPVVVGRCETVSDAGKEDVTVGDLLQRFKGESKSWEDTLPRNQCWADGTAKFESKLLWPSQQLHSPWFFPNVGFPGFPFQHGDRVRFVLFTGPPEQYSGGIPSPEFVIK